MDDVVLGQSVLKPARVPSAMSLLEVHRLTVVMWEKVRELPDPLTNGKEGEVGKPLIPSRRNSSPPASPHLWAACSILFKSVLSELPE